MQKTISLTAGVVRMEKWRMAEPVDFDMAPDDNIAIIGPNGGGKSMLVDIITGAHPLQSGAIAYDFSNSAHDSISANIKYVCFKDLYGGDSDKSYYLQQRWNQTEIDEDTQTVEERLEIAYNATGDDNEQRRLLKEKIKSVFGLQELLDKQVVLLSSGELRKLTIASAIFSQPRLLIIDSPFIGLDPESRLLLTKMLRNLCNSKEIQVILVVNRLNDIPDFITHVVEVTDMRVGKKVRREEYFTIVGQRQKDLAERKVKEDETLRNLIQEAVISDNERNCFATDKEKSKMVVEMDDVCIKYGKRTILSNITWNIGRGEHWALTGQNGSGKSTLLSLVCADNPQSYACNIALFGRKRGSGESIWDIKQRIGYVSPEMHRAFRANVVTEQVVASGFCNVMGMFRKPSAEQLIECRLWMRIFGIENTLGRRFLELSSGEQRLALLARAFVKKPQLLILDEPLHGLDDTNRERVKMIVDEYCKFQDKTLIMVSHYHDEFPECIDHQLSLIKNK